MLSNHSGSCFQIRGNARLPFLCCKHEEGLGAYGAEVPLWLCFSVCVLFPSTQKLGLDDTSHIVRVFTSSGCLLMLSQVHLKSSDISIGNLPRKLRSLSKYFSLI